MESLIHFDDGKNATWQPRCIKRARQNSRECRRRPPSSSVSLSPRQTARSPFTTRQFGLARLIWATFSSVVRRSGELKSVDRRPVVRPLSDGASNVRVCGREKMWRRASRVPARPRQAASVSAQHHLSAEHSNDCRPVSTLALAGS
jgi:hypothetical protein